MVLLVEIESTPPTVSRSRSTTELQQLVQTGEIESPNSDWQSEIFPLNYICIILERHVGLEPTPKAWKALMLPLHQ